MGRFETLNPDTQDIVTSLLPRIADAFGVDHAVDIIPADIRMRAWDCERRDHIKDQTENDPRNWGVQFLKDLNAIARINGGDLDEFHARLRAKIELHEDYEKHPWCRLTDIKAIRIEYENPNRPEPQSAAESSVSSVDSYLEELHEPDLPKGSKRKRKGIHEVYETRVQLPRKPGRLRRAEDGTRYRKEKHSNKRRRSSKSTSYRTPERRTNRIVSSDDDDQASVGSLRARPHASYSATPASLTRNEILESATASNEPLEVQVMQAELELAEAELKAARLKYQVLQAKEAAEQGGTPKP